jgi:hypothetical protein
MLERFIVGCVARLRAIMGRQPGPVPPPLDAAEREATRVRAQLGWLLPLLRAALASVWLTAGIVSLGIYPIAESLTLLARTGLTGTAAYAALYGAPLLDFGLGIATLAMRRRRGLWLSQIALVAVYTVIITVFLTEQWAHPYGPVVKNVPIMAALVLLYTLERR